MDQEGISVRQQGIGSEENGNHVVQPPTVWGFLRSVRVAGR